MCKDFISKILWAQLNEDLDDNKCGEKLKNSQRNSLVYLYQLSHYSIFGLYIATVIGCKSLRLLSEETSIAGPQINISILRVKAFTCMSDIFSLSKQSILTTTGKHLSKLLVNHASFPGIIYAVPVHARKQCNTFYGAFLYLRLR